MMTSGTSSNDWDLWKAFSVYSKMYVNFPPYEPAYIGKIKIMMIENDLHIYTFFFIRNIIGLKHYYKRLRIGKKNVYNYNIVVILLQ